MEEGCQSGWPPSAFEAQREALDALLSNRFGQSLTLRVMVKRSSLDTPGRPPSPSRQRRSAGLRSGITHHDAFGQACGGRAIDRSSRRRRTPRRYANVLAARCCPAYCTAQQENTRERARRRRSGVSIANMRAAARRGRGGARRSGRSDDSERYLRQKL
jgi:hypothetical protein